MTKKRRSNSTLIRAMTVSSSLISYLVGPILVGVLGGGWIDETFETDPLFVIVGLLFGLAVGVYGIFRLLKQYLGED